VDRQPADRLSGCLSVSLSLCLSVCLSVCLLLRLNSSEENNMPLGLGPVWFNELCPPSRKEKPAGCGVEPKRTHPLQAVASNQRPCDKQTAAAPRLPSVSANHDTDPGGLSPVVRLVTRVHQQTGPMGPRAVPSTHGASLSCRLTHDGTNGIFHQTSDTHAHTHTPTRHTHSSPPPQSALQPLVLIVSHLA